MFSVCTERILQGFGGEEDSRENLAPSEEESSAKERDANL
jgi:hypothetical protein